MIQICQGMNSTKLFVYILTSLFAINSSKFETKPFNPNMLHKQSLHGAFGKMC